jgi:hypothetical protein
LTLRFDRRGMYKFTCKLASQSPIYRNPNGTWPEIPWTREPQQPQPQQPPQTGLQFEVGTGLTKSNLGTASSTHVRINVWAIARDVTRHFKRSPKQFPIAESIAEAISECSVHELIHAIGRVSHKRTAKWSDRDFMNVTGLMGIPIRQRLYAQWGVTFSRKIHEIRVIEVEN